MMAGSDWAVGFDTIVFEGCDGAGKTTLAQAAEVRLIATDHPDEHA